MTCTICINDGNIKTMYNDCIIESLEKIKFHYMSLKGKLNENEQLTKTLREENDKLKKILSQHESIENNETKKRRTASCEEDTDSEISFSQNVVKSIAQKSADDLNMALNFDEEEFELSFIPSTQVEVERKKKLGTAKEREPLKVLPVKTQISNDNKPLIIKQESKLNEEIDTKCNKSLSLKKSSSWISKENELKRSVLGGSIQKRTPNRSLRLIKQEHKNTSMSLKPGKLRQTRLQLDISKNLSGNFSDTTFCDEAIEASPNADSSLKRINSSKQWQLRNISSKLIKSDDDSSILNFTNPSPKKETKSQSPPKNNNNNSLETSSVVMFTPASQDIIFLDDSSESFNIESMDLLKDLMNPTENLSNLKRIESNGIKMLQKTNGGHAGGSGNIPSKCSDFDEKQNPKTIFKTEHEFAKPKAVDKNELKNPLKEDNALIKDNSDFGNNNKPHISTPLKTGSTTDGTKRARKFDINCNECQTYIKYLGARLTDEQIEQHIRNCTNHKKPIDDNLTPDGFWDPVIKPFASDDPRNLTIIDDPFVEKKN
ncbi:uncharacterized protein LOC129919750 [Episyrphus balteatus]|uniref:uncharacterized protein LOC129919750 n=1 Tax=Episyrphus balteatus TaxID=286459 RepID=UPI0024851449|nr:uncharacterized protein LOC129919750 [Episyrphus balteatus]